MGDSSNSDFVFNWQGAEKKIKVCWKVQPNLKDTLKISAAKSRLDMSYHINEALSAYLRENFPDEYNKLKNVKPNTT